MKTLSEQSKARRSNILQFVASAMIDGRPPTIRQIGAACYISSTSVVNFYLKIMRDQGLVEHNTKFERGIRLSKSGMASVGYFFKKCPHCGHMEYSKDAAAQSKQKKRNIRQSLQIHTAI